MYEAHHRVRKLTRKIHHFPQALESRYIIPPQYPNLQTPPKGENMEGIRYEVKGSDDAVDKSHVTPVLEEKKAGTKRRVRAFHFSVACIRLYMPRRPSIRRSVRLSNFLFTTMSFKVTPSHSMSFTATKS